MLLKTIKIKLPCKEGGANNNVATRTPDYILEERRNPVVKSNLKSIKDYGKEFDITRLLFTRIQER